MPASVINFTNIFGKLRLYAAHIKNIFLTKKRYADSCLMLHIFFGSRKCFVNSVL